MRFDDTRTEWRINDIERSLQNKADSHEIFFLRSNLGSMEHSLRESRSETYELRSQLQTLQEAVETLQRDLVERLVEAESADTENDQELIVLQDFYWAVHAIVYANLKERK